VTFTFKSIDRDEVRRIVKACGPTGHAILEPAGLEDEAGVEQGTLDDLVVIYRSHVDNPKWQIQDPIDGHAIDKIRGIWSLHLLQRVAHDLDIDVENNYLGRGSEAKFLYSRIMDVLQGAAE